MTIHQNKDIKLTLRRNGKYYQAGYYKDRRWVNVMHLGTAHQIVCKLTEAKNIANQLKYLTKKPTINITASI